MSNHAWVCFDCRRAVRRLRIASDVRCPACGGQCECLGDKVPIPPRSRVRAWSALRERFYDAQRQRLLQRHVANVAHLPALHRQIAWLTSLPTNEGRLRHLHRLKRELRRRTG